MLRPARYWFRLLLAALIALAPVLPAYAFSERAEDGPQAHATAEPSAHHHADHAQAGSDAKSSPCDQHEGCLGQCCATCAQCFTVAPVQAASAAGSRPVQTAIVHALHDSLLISLLIRPPQAG